MHSCSISEEHFIKLKGGAVVYLYTLVHLESKVMSLASRIQDILERKALRDAEDGDSGATRTSRKNPWCADTEGRRFDGLLRPFCKHKTRAPSTHHQGAAGGAWDMHGCPTDTEITCCGDEGRRPWYTPH